MGYGNKKNNSMIQIDNQELRNELTTQLAEREKQLKTHVAPTSLTNGYMYKRKPVVSLTFDDAPIEDFTELKSIMDSYGVKGTIYVNSNRVGKTLDSQEYMSIEQIKQFYNEGWEMGSHTASHSFLSFSNLQTQPLIGDTSLKVVNGSPDKPFYNASYGSIKCQIFELNNESINETVIVTSNSLVSGIDTVTLSSPVTKSFTNAKIRLHPDEVEKEILGTKHFLNQNGMECNTCAYPWGDAERNAKEVVSKHFSVGRLASGSYINANNGGVFDNSEVPLNSYDLLCVELLGLSTSQIDTLVSECKANNSWLIVLGHSYADGWFDNLEYLIQKCESEGIDMLPMSEGLRYHNNLIDLGIGSNRFVVAHEGTVSGGVTNVKTAFYNNASNITSFPYGVSIMRSRVSDNGGFPTPSGTLITYRTKNASVGEWTFQYWHDSTSNKLYYRNAISGATFRPWLRLDPALIYANPNTHTPSSTVANFEAYKITSEAISDSTAASVFPESTKGILTTDNIHPYNGYLTQKYDLFNTNREYTRSIKTDGTATEWEMTLKGKTYVQVDLGTITIPANSSAQYELSSVSVTNSAFAMVTPYSPPVGNMIIHHKIESAKLYVVINNLSASDLTGRFRFNVVAVKNI